VTNCIHCGDEFTPYRQTQKYCGYACKKTFQYLRSVGRDAYVERTSKGRWISGNGYISIKINGKLKYEHRHIMEQHLGRELLPTEVVHHKNEDARDNRIENLELIESQAEHVRRHWRCE